MGMRALWPLAIGCACASSGAVAQNVPGERSLHRYLSVVIAPSAEYVAAIEGDAPQGGSA